jgi:hypothetical protein
MVREDVAMLYPPIKFPASCDYSASSLVIWRGPKTPRFGETTLDASVVARHLQLAACVGEIDRGALASSRHALARGSFLTGCEYSGKCPSPKGKVAEVVNTHAPFTLPENECRIARGRTMGRIRPPPER